MAKFTVDLVRYDMDKTKKRKRKNFFVEDKSEQAVIDKLERIHKGEKVVEIHEITWGEVEEDIVSDVEAYVGTVKFYDDVKGFGFIRPNIDIDDLFFHASALGGAKNIVDNSVVSFEIGEGPKGDVAIKIKLVE